MLVRCGVGKLILYDYDKVELANMNRLFYTPDQVGLSKVEAARKTLLKINDKVEIEVFNHNITTSENYEQMKEKILKGGKTPETRVNLVISCVDNYAARSSINGACNELQQLWIESGVSEDALNCHFQLMIPGETACFSCMPPLAMIENNEHTIKREGVCTASLPTTMGITAGFIAQNVLKILLRFEEITYYLSYNSRNEFFSRTRFDPNPECKDKNCLKNQKFMKENQDKLFIKIRESSQEYIKNQEYKKQKISKVINIFAF
jgi:ubiquitin-like modifier-activating enzyme 5